MFHHSFRLYHELYVVLPLTLYLTTIGKIMAFYLLEGREPWQLIKTTPTRHHHSPLKKKSSEKIAKKKELHLYLCVFSSAIFDWQNYFTISLNNILLSLSLPHLCLLNHFSPFVCYKLEVWFDSYRFMTYCFVVTSFRYQSFKFLKTSKNA